MYSDLNPSGGGRETWLQYFLPALLEQKVFGTIHLYSLAGEESAVSKYTELAKTYPSLVWHQIHRSKLPLFWEFSRSVKTLLRGLLGPKDLILSVGPIIDSLPIVTMSATKKVPFICWVRSIASGEVGVRHKTVITKAAKWLETKAMERATAVVANGQDTLTWYSANYPMYAKKMLLIANAIPTATFAAIPDPDFTKKPIKVAYIGRLVEDKGIDSFTESANLVPADSPFEFHVWGKGPREESVKASKAKFHGQVSREQIPAVLEECHVVVHLSIVGDGICSGVSHNLLECLAAGRMVVAFRNNAYSQVITDEEGFFAKEGDAADLACAYHHIAALSPAEITARAKRGREIAADYSVETHVAKFIQLQQKLGQS
jgi:glycosyltransferase involved in cell wall biosynthesis